MKIDVGEGTRAAGAAAEDRQIHGYGGINTGATRSDAGSTRAVAVAQQQQQAAAPAVAGGSSAEGTGKLEGVGGTSLPIPNGISAGGGGVAASAVKIVTLSAQQHGGLDGSAIVGSEEYQVCVCGDPWILPPARGVFVFSRFSFGSLPAVWLVVPGGEGCRTTTWHDEGSN